MSQTGNGKAKHCTMRSACLCAPLAETVHTLDAIPIKRQVMMSTDLSWSRVLVPTSSSVARTTPQFQRQTICQGKALVYGDSYYISLWALAQLVVAEQGGPLQRDRISAAEKDSDDSELVAANE